MTNRLSENREPTAVSVALAAVSMESDILDAARAPDYRHVQRCAACGLDPDVLGDIERAYLSWVPSRVCAGRVPGWSGEVWRWEDHARLRGLPALRLLTLAAAYGRIIEESLPVNGTPWDSDRARVACEALRGASKLASEQIHGLAGRPTRTQQSATGGNGNLVGLVAALPSSWEAEVRLRASGGTPPSHEHDVAASAVLCAPGGIQELPDRCDPAPSVDRSACRSDWSPPHPLSPPPPWSPTLESPQIPNKSQDSINPLESLLDL